MKYYILILFIASAVVLSGCIGQQTTAQVASNQSNLQSAIRCQYTDGTFCNQTCCSTGDKCDIQNYSYAKCDLTSGMWYSGRFSDSGCRTPCQTIDVIQQPPTTNILNETTCVGDSVYQRVRYSDGSEYIVFKEQCAYGCDAGQCKSSSSNTLQTNSICTPNSIDCNGDWIRKCMYDGSGWLENYEYCTYGCTNWICNQAPCQSRYLDEYRCSGNTREVKFQYANCSAEWRYIESCTNGCQNTSCVTASYQICTPNSTGCSGNYIKNVMMMVLDGIINTNIVRMDA